MPGLGPGLKEGCRPSALLLRPSLAVSDLPLDWLDCSGTGSPGMSKDTFLTEEEDLMLRDSLECSDLSGSSGIVWLNGSSLLFLIEESDREVSTPPSFPSTDFFREPLSLGTST